MILIIISSSFSCHFIIRGSTTIAVIIFILVVPHLINCFTTRYLLIFLLVICLKCFYLKRIYIFLYIRPIHTQKLAVFSLGKILHLFQYNNHSYFTRFFLHVTLSLQTYDTQITKMPFALLICVPLKTNHTPPNTTKQRGPSLACARRTLLLYHLY